MTTEGLKPFNAIQYKTKDGETITATKKDGIVTLVGDKNGVRQMPYEKFMKDLINSLPQVNMERVPQKDTVNFSGQSKTLNKMDIKVNDGFLGMGKRKITGTIDGKKVNFVIDTNTWGNKAKLNGTINGKKVNLTLKNYNLEGDLAEEDRHLVPYLQLLMNDKKHYDNELNTIALMV